MLICDQHNSSVICSLLLSVSYSNCILRVWSLAKFVFLKSGRVKKDVDKTLAILTEAGTRHQELFTHTLFVWGITLWNIERTVALAELGRCYEMIEKEDGF